MNRKRLFFLGVVFTLLVSVTAAAASPPLSKRPDVTVHQIEASLHDDWFGIYSKGKKTGFLHDIADKVTEDGRTLYRTRKFSQAKLLVLGQKSEIKEEETFYFSAQSPFALVRAEYVFEDGDRRKVITVTAADKGYEATITAGKVTEKKTLNVDFTLADVVSADVWLKRGYAKGETITLRQFNLSELTMGKISMKWLDCKQVENSKVSEVEVTDHRAEFKTTGIVRYDSKARLLSGHPAEGVEVRRESEIEARKIDFGDDVVFANMARLDRPVGLKTADDFQKIKGLTLRGKGKVHGIFPATALQSVCHEGDDVYVIKIGKLHGQKVIATDKEIQESLTETPEYPIRDAKVIELAKQAIGDARTDKEKVERLCKFVNKYLKYEIVLSPKVHDIIERKVGECKAHAMLFATLARSVGVPTREASGYVYMGDSIKGFGQHYWNEVVIDGRWVPVDATAGSTDLPPFYVCVGSGANVLDNMMQAYGRLSFELVAVDREE